MENVSAEVVVFVACSICEEFEVIAERALREVATTEELMEMIDYIEEARTNGMRKLNQRVAVSEHIIMNSFCALVFGPKSQSANMGETVVLKHHGCCKSFNIILILADRIVTRHCQLLTS